MEVSVYHLISILEKVENKNIKVNIQTYGKQPTEISDIVVTGFLSNGPKLIIKTED